MDSSKESVKRGPSKSHEEAASGRKNDEDEDEQSTSSLTGVRSSGVGEISALGPYDVICGKTRTAYHHTGNRRFRIIIGIHVDRYVQASSRKAKREVIHSVFLIFRREIGSRFVRETEEGRFVEVSDKIVRQKIGHALRDQSVTNKFGGRTPSRSSSISSSSSSVVVPSFGRSHSAELSRELGSLLATRPTLHATQSLPSNISSSARQLGREPIRPPPARSSLLAAAAAPQQSFGNELWLQPSSNNRVNPTMSFQREERRNFPDLHSSQNFLLFGGSSLPPPSSSGGANTRRNSTTTPSSSQQRGEGLDQESPISRLKLP